MLLEIEFNNIAKKLQNIKYLNANLFKFREINVINAKVLKKNNK